MVSGLSHITFVVKDLEKTAEFLVNIFDANEVYSSGDKTYSVSREKFFLIGNIWIAIMEGNSLSERSYNHIAFQISEDEYDGYIERIERAGAQIKETRPREEGEGRSIYFYDFDNHLFELHTGTLAEHLKCYSV